jgi:hypothetical protein
MWLKNNEPELCERAKEIVQAQRLALKEAGKDEDVELRRDVLTLLMSVWMFKVYKALEPYGEATGQSVDDWCR